MIKQTKGLYTKESSKFKHNGDLDFFCKLFEKHLQKHGLDSVAYHRCPTGNRNMMSLFTNYPKFLVKDIKKQNITFGSLYDKYNKQNDIEATKCLLNSLNSKLCKDIMAQTDKDMLFSQVFMIFIEHEWPQHVELYDAVVT